MLLLLYLASRSTHHLAAAVLDSGRVDLLAELEELPSRRL
jgi:hypothetical protein